MSPVRSPRRVFLLLPLTALPVLLLLACGGGTDVAPSNPAPSGTGMAQIHLNAVDLGQTQLVTSDITGALSADQQVTAEPGTFAAGNTFRLMHSPLAAAPHDQVALNVPGPPPVTYTPETPGCPLSPPPTFWVDHASGVVTRCPTGPIPSGAVTVDYWYQVPLSTVKVGITLPSGSQVDLTVFNIPANQPGPLSTNQVSLTAPLNLSLAFTAQATTDLSLPPGQQKSYVAVAACSVAGAPGCPALNQLDISSVDLSNPTDPCIAGSLTLVVRDASDPSAPYVVLDGSFADTHC